MPFSRLVLLMCAYLCLTLLGMHSVPALLPLFAKMWTLSNTEAGWLAGISYLTYPIAVPFVGMTDRIDARRMLILEALINAVGYGCMRLADGLWDALGYRALQGFGLAWSYMPGVKAMSDRIEGDRKGRAAAIYVSSFATGWALSVWLAAEITSAFGWQWVFAVPAVSNLLAAALLLALLPPATPESDGQPRRLWPDFRPVRRNRAALGYVLGTFAHNFELQGIHSRTVTFLTWAAATRPDLPDGFNPALAAMLLILIGVPSSFVGAEFGHRIGYARTSFLAMAISAALAVLVGFSAAWWLWAFVALVVAHNLLALVDSGTLNGGAVNAATPGPSRQHHGRRRHRLGRRRAGRPGSGRRHPRRHRRRRYCGELGLGGGRPARCRRAGRRHRRVPVILATRINRNRHDHLRCGRISPLRTGAGGEFPF